MCLNVFLRGTQDYAENPGRRRAEGT